MYNRFTRLPMAIFLVCIFTLTLQNTFAQTPSTCVEQTPFFILQHDVGDTLLASAGCTVNIPDAISINASVTTGLSCNTGVFGDCTPDPLVGPVFLPPPISSHNPGQTGIPVGTFIELYYAHNGFIDSSGMPILKQDTFCIRTFAYEDEDPEITFTDPMTEDSIYFNCTIAPPYSMPAVSAIDNCTQGIIPVLLLETTKTNNGTCNDFEYQIKRTWIATDDSGNTDSLFQWVFVDDNIGPNFDEPNDTTINCDASILPANLGSPTNIMDDCQPLSAITVSHTDLRDTFSCSDSIRITRTWRVEDLCQNNQLKIQTIWLIDTLPPNFILPKDTTVSCSGASSPAQTGLPTMVSDNCDGSITPTFSDVIVTGACENQLTIVRTWTAEDTCGNSFSADQTINVIDTIAPTITQIASNRMFQCGSQSVNTIFSNWINNHGGAQATDECGGQVTWVAQNSGTSDPASLSTVTCGTNDDGIIREVKIDFLAKDACGNTDTTSAFFIQIDTVAPNIIACPSNLNLENDPGFCGTNVTFQPPRFTDDCFDVLQSFDLKDSTSITSNGAFGNIDSIVNPVIVQLFVSDPALTIIGNSVDFVFDLKNVDADDAATEYFNIYSEDGTLLGQTNPTPTQCNSSSTKTITITNLNLFYSWISDGIIEFTLDPYPAFGLDGRFAINNICPDSKVIVSTQFDAKVTEDIAFEYAISTNGSGKVKVDPITSFTEFLPIGSHEITYCITDCGGNVDSCNFVVVVTDTESPVITCPQDLTINVDSNSCNTNYTLPLPANAFDNCGFPGSYSSTEPANGPRRFIRFYDDPDLNDYLAMDKFISFGGITGNASGNTGQLTVYFLADMESVGEYFTVLGEDGTVLGTTEVGQANVTPGDCNTIGSAVISIPDSLINAWAVDSSITITFESNTSFSVPPGGGNGLGINPCGPTAGNNVFFELDSISMLWAELSFDEITPTYYSTGATTINNTLYASGHNATHNFNLGVTDVSFFLDDVNGNRDTCTFQVEVVDNQNPVANCIPSMIKINPSGTVQGVINANDLGSTSTDNCGIASMMTLPSTVSCDSIDQTIDIKLIVEDIGGNRDTCYTILRIEGEEPIPSFSYQCGSDTLFLFANPPASSSANGYSYKWFGPNGSLISTQQNPKITAPSNIQSGSYCVEIEGLTGCSSTGCLNIPLDLSPPQPTVTGPSTVCWDTDDITLNTTPPSGFGGQVSYNWYAGTFPGGTLIRSTVTPSFVMSAPHSLTPNTVDNRCFYSTITINGCESSPSNVLCMDVVRPPTAIVSDPTLTICENETLQLNTPVNGSTSLVYQWVGPSQFNVPNPVVTMNVDPNIHSGNYDLTVFLNGCPSNTATTIVNVLDVPDGKPNITPTNQEICIGNSFTLSTNLTGVSSYRWKPPTGPEISTTDPFLPLFATSDHDGPWRVCGVISYSNPNIECRTESSDVANVVVNTFPQQIVAIASPAQVCTGNDAMLQVTPVIPGASYVWRNSAGTQVGVGPNALLSSVQNNDQGTYCVTVTNLAGCVQVECTQVMVSEGVEVVTASNNGPNCFTGRTDVELSLIVSPPDDGTYEYLWTGPCNYMKDDSLSIVDLLDFENCRGTYSVQVTNGEGCKSNIESTTIDGLAPLDDPIISIANNQRDFCQGDEIVITVNSYSGTDVTYNWYLPQGGTTMTTTPQLVISSAFPTNHSGNYFLDVLVDGCRTSFSSILSLTVNPIPFAVAQAIEPCEGGTLELISNYFPAGGTPTYQWTFPDNSSSAAANPNITDANPIDDNGTYTLVVTRNGCESAPSTVNANITDAPIMPEFVESNDVCLGDGQPLNLCLNSLTAVSGASYIWTIGSVDGDTLGQTNSLCLPLNDLSGFDEGVYPIFVTTEKDGCSTSNPSPLTITFTNLPSEKADAGADFTICQDDELILNATPISDGTGCWKYLGGITGVSFDNPFSATTLVTGLPPGNTYDFVWSLGKGACTDYSVDTISVTIFAQENAFAGADIDTCNTTTFNLNAIPSSSGLGMWVQDSIQANLGVVIENPSDPRTLVTVPGPSPNYFFRWVIPNQVCGGASDEIVVNIGSPTAFAGIDIDACGNGDAVLNATTSASGMGMWTALDPDILFADPFESGTVVENLSDGENVFVWTIDNGICGPGSIDTVVVFYDLSPIAIRDTVPVTFGGVVDFEPGTNDLGATNFLIKAISTPTQGAIENIGNGALEYTAPFNFIGTDSIVYEICPVDATCACTQSTVLFEVGLNISECDIPSIITPNGDNMNEFLTIGCVADVSKFPNNELIIFNQWGDEVYRAGPYLNDWYGTFKGEELPAGTYFYILDLGTGDNPMTGFLVIQR